MKDTEIIEEFEKTIAEYTGANYGVAVSSCTNAIFLCLQYLLHTGELKKGDTITLPSRTYLSVPCQVKLCGLNIKFEDIKWSGLYQLEPTRIYDSATRFMEDMFVEEPAYALYCLSFQYRKHLKMGRGGMVVTNDPDAVKWLKMARFNGRHEDVPQAEDELEFCGWNMYMLPEDAARGLTLFSLIDETNEDCGGYKYYPDLSKQKVFK